MRSRYPADSGSPYHNVAAGQRLNPMKPIFHEPILRPIVTPSITQIVVGLLAESFVRVWEYYLCYCEGEYEERPLGDV